MKDIKLEKALLASMFGNSSNCEYAIDNLDEMHFSEIELQDAFSAISEVWSELGRIDFVSFLTKYYDNVLFNMKTIAEESQTFFDEYSFSKASDRLVELKKCRELATSLERGMKLAIDGKLEEALKIANDSSMAVDIDDDNFDSSTGEELADQMIDVIDNWEEYRKNKIPTRFDKINNLVNGGFAEGDLVILAAPTGHGKTNLALNMFDFESDIPIALINTEMGQKQLARRLITIVSNSKGVTYSQIERGNLSDGGIKLAKKSAEIIRNSKFKTITVPNLTLSKAEKIIKNYKKKYSTRVFIVDYLGRMDTSDPKKQEWQVLSSIAKKLKTVAQEKKCLIIMVAQLNSAGYLQGSKAIENECDAFIVLDRPKEVDGEDDEKVADKIKFYNGINANGSIKLKKNRIGKESSVLIKFCEDTLNFSEIER